jgi:mRNA interferase RelE/StbE
VYKVDFKPAALSNLRKLAQRMRASDWARLEQAIEGLASEPRPHGVRKLSGVDLYRVRVGAYRVIYTVDDQDRTVTVTKVARRSKATYR